MCYAHSQTATTFLVLAVLNSVIHQHPAHELVVFSLKRKAWGGSSPLTGVLFACNSALIAADLGLL